jgi:hypothetical protein
MTVHLFSAFFLFPSDSYHQLGVQSRYFRPFGGVIDARARLVMGDMRFTVVTWDIDVRDATLGPSDPQKQQLLNFRTQLDAGGSLAVMTYSFNSTIDQLDDMIVYARGKGRRFVPLSQCLAATSPSSSQSGTGLNLPPLRYFVLSF